ncbi:transglutaminase domain-containing protein [Butyrivibrio sp. LB2008]|uniref:transglutaminase domain-containing protein n=1 Tax=Butyrivibrio sp. LB2008 TaxID=1408305 RepID=UPI00047DEAFB|nr:transglutaminase domain-containing protein [Butyrivibrio sp. LB2008]
MKYLAKLLYVILGIIIAVCVFILICGLNPNISLSLKGVVDDVAEKKRIMAEQKAIENSSTDAQAEIPLEVESVEKDGEDAALVAEPEYNNDLTYQDYVDMWDDSVVNRNYINNPDYQEFIDAFVSPYEDSDDDYPADRSDMQLPQPQIIDIEDEEKAKEIIDELDYGNTGEGLEFDQLFYPYYHMLNNRGQALYRQIYANALAQKQRFAPVLADAKNNEIKSAFCCVLDDHPEIFWVDISFYTQYDYQGNVIEFDFRFYRNFNDIQFARVRFDKMANNLIEGAKDLKTDYEKELYVHDVIVDKLSYQHNSLDQSAYSSVVEDYTVCAGYARCFQYLMQLLGVPAYNCCGWGGGEPHAWNIVKLEDGFHNVDCTWDDSNSNYNYFNLSDAENKNHRRMDFSVYLPKCVSSKHKPSFKTEEAGVPGIDDGTGPEAKYYVTITESDVRPYYYIIDFDGNVTKANN